MATAEGPATPLEQQLRQQQRIVAMEAEDSGMIPVGMFPVGMVNFKLGERRMMMMPPGVPCREEPTS